MADQLRTLCLPTGDEVRTDEFGSLAALLTLDQEYWNGGGGGGSLVVPTPGGEAQLDFTRAEPFGFHLDLWLPFDGKGPRRYVATHPAAPDQVVEFLSGGESRWLPAKWFIRPEAAVPAVRYFFEHGERDPRLTWVDRNEVDWNWMSPTGR